MSESEGLFDNAFVVLHRDVNGATVLFFSRGPQLGDGHWIYADIQKIDWRAVQ